MDLPGMPVCASAAEYAAIAACTRAALMRASASCEACPAGAEPSANEAVDGTTVGPVSRLQPLAQPVAAGPTKFGDTLPRLDAVTGAASTPVGSANRVSGREAR